MFDDWAWKSYNRVIKEVREPTPFKSRAQKRYKKLRKKNDIYTNRGGLKNTSAGSPYTGKVKRFGTDRLRFESIEEVVDIKLLKSLEPSENMSEVLWQDMRLREEAEDLLLQVANDFLSSLDLDVPMKNLYIVGSMASLNYSEFSDIDLHIVLDFGDISSDKDLLRKYFYLAKSKWNRTRKVMIGGHDVEIYVEDLNDERLPTATYSVMRKEWINQPSMEGLEIDYQGVTKKVTEKMSEVDELESLYEDGEYKEAYEFGTLLRQKIKRFRQAGLDKRGEYSNENLAFKLLRRSGALDRINDYVKSSYAEMVSIKT